MELRDKKVLITGGCGLIGSTIADRLVGDEGVAKIIIIDDLSRGTEGNIAWARDHGEVELVEADVRDRDAIRPYFRDIDVVFHQAAIRITACAENPRLCQEVLIDGTYNVVEACADACVGRLVAASSASVYGMADRFPTTEEHHLFNNRTWYGAAKIANEALYRAFHDMAGLNYIALRYFNVYGPRMDAFGKYTEVLIRWLDCLDEGTRPRIFGDGEQTMDFVYADDVAAANVLAAKSDVNDEVFNIGSGSETSLRELLDALLAATNNQDVEPEFAAERNVNPVPRRLADTRKARRLLGFECQTDLETGLRRLIEWRRDVIQKAQDTHHDSNLQACCRA